MLIKACLSNGLVIATYQCAMRTSGVRLMDMDLNSNPCSAMKFTRFLGLVISKVVVSKVNNLIYAVQSQLEEQHNTTVINERFARQFHSCLTFSLDSSAFSLVFPNCTASKQYHQCTRNTRDCFTLSLHNLLAPGCRVYGKS